MHGSKFIENIFFVVLKMYYYRFSKGQYLRLEKKLLMLERFERSTKKETRRLVPNTRSYLSTSSHPKFISGYVFQTRTSVMPSVGLLLLGERGHKSHQKGEDLYFHAT